MASYAGIDYSLGQSNVDKTNGIHYGVVSQHSLGDWINETIMDGANYGPPTCPKCGNTIKASDDESLFTGKLEDKYGEPIELDDDGTPSWFDGKDYTCIPCQECYWSDSVFSEEMLGWASDDGDYSLTDCLDSDVFILRSPFYTFAQYCSPCVPGAGNLDNPCPDGPKTYCMGHDWFEDGVAPYPVYEVATGLPVIPEAR
jgi:hypothetical protein